MEYCGSSHPLTVGKEDSRNCFFSSAVIHVSLLVTKGRIIPFILLKMLLFFQIVKLEGDLYVKKNRGTG